AAVPRNLPRSEACCQTIEVREEGCGARLQDRSSAQPWPIFARDEDTGKVAVGEKPTSLRDLTSGTGEASGEAGCGGAAENDASIEPAAVPWSQPRGPCGRHGPARNEFRPCCCRCVYIDKTFAGQAGFIAELSRPLRIRRCFQ
ncbi:unnamed protein product, partial [Symbiodinium sp. CCMP2456]